MKLDLINVEIDNDDFCILFRNKIYVYLSFITIKNNENRSF